MQKLLFLLLIIIPVNCLSQNRNSVWCFGDSAGIDFGNVANPATFNTQVKSRGSCASIADSSGQLLLYVFNKVGNFDHATSIYNHLHLLIQNGDSLVGEGMYNEMNIIPDPVNSNQYYLFTSLTVFPMNPGFFYSIIDVSLNGGLGEVIQKNVQLLNVDIADAVQAIKHGNGRDWWILAKQAGVGGPTQFNRFHVFLLTPSGITLSSSQDLGLVYDPDLCKVIFNSNGTKFVQIGYTGFMHQYGFDRCSGSISNPDIIFSEPPNLVGRHFWEGAYSPNDSLFYVVLTWTNSNQSDTSYLLQFDLFTSNVSLSADTIFWSRSPETLGAIRKAPDDKVYVTTAYYWGGFVYPYPDSVYNIYNMNLGVINNPNQNGSGCNFQPYSFHLGGARTYWGLPNNPNFELGPLTGSICDTLNVGVNEITANNSSLFVYYDVAWKKVFINAQKLKGKNAELKIYNLNGQIIYSSSSKTKDGYFSADVDMQNFSSGLYIISLQTEKEKLVKKFIVN